MALKGGSIGRRSASKCCRPVSGSLRGVRHARGVGTLVTVGMRDGFILCFVLGQSRNEEMVRDGALHTEKAHEC